MATAGGGGAGVGVSTSRVRSMPSTSVATAASVSSLSPLARPFTLPRSSATAVAVSGAVSSAGRGDLLNSYPSYSTTVVSTRAGEVKGAELEPGRSYVASSNSEGYNGPFGGSVIKYSTGANEEHFGNTEFEYLESRSSPIQHCNYENFTNVQLGHPQRMLAHTLSYGPRRFQHGTLNSEDNSDVNWYDNYFSSSGNIHCDDWTEARDGVQLGGSALLDNTLMKYDEQVKYGYNFSRGSLVASNLSTGGLPCSPIAITLSNAKPYDVPSSANDMHTKGPYVCDRDSIESYLPTSALGQLSVSSAAINSTNNQLGLRSNNVDIAGNSQRSVNAIKMRVNEGSKPSSSKVSIALPRSLAVDRVAEKNPTGCSKEKICVTKPSPINIPQIPESAGSVSGDSVQNADDKSLDSPCWPGKSTPFQLQALGTVQNTPKKLEAATESSTQGQGANNYTPLGADYSKRCCKAYYPYQSSIAEVCISSLAGNISHDKGSYSLSRKLVDISLMTIYSHSEVLMNAASHDEIELTEHDRVLVSSVITNLQNVLCKTNKVSGEGVLGQVEEQKSSNAFASKSDLEEQQRSIVLNSKNDVRHGVTQACQNLNEVLFPSNDESLEACAYKNLWRDAGVENASLKLQLDYARLKHAFGANVASGSRVPTDLLAPSHDVTKPTGAKFNPRRETDQNHLGYGRGGSRLSSHGDSREFSLGAVTLTAPQSYSAGVPHSGSELFYSDWEHVLREDLAPH